MLTTCYKLGLLFSTASNKPFPAKPLATHWGQEKIHSAWRDFFCLHEILPLHHLHPLCSTDFITVFTSQDLELPPIHPASPPWHYTPFIVATTISVQVPSNLHDSCICMSGHIRQHFCYSFCFATFNFHWKIPNSINFNSIHFCCLWYLTFVFDK